MSFYPLLLELFLYGTAAYLFHRKRDLIILYVPMLVFVRILIEEPLLRAVIWYFLITGFIVFSAYRANILRRINLLAIAILFYFTILYLLSHDPADTRNNYFSMFCLFSVFIIAPALYLKYGYDTVVGELRGMASIYLALFIVNAIICSATGYAPNPLYGRTSGVLFGSMGGTAFMGVPIAIFIFLGLKKGRVNFVETVVALLAAALVVLSMRRTAAAAAIVALLAVVLVFALDTQGRQLMLIGSAGVFLATLALVFTDVNQQFFERFEERIGDDGQVVDIGEGRFTDHTMVYEDMFVYGRYSPAFGYGFFDSPGNYGGGEPAVSAHRSLHPDIPVIAHASGLIGVVLYLLLVGSAFLYNLRHCVTRKDRVLWGLCFTLFLIFTLSGRITQTAYSMTLFLTLYAISAPRFVAAQASELKAEYSEGFRPRGKRMVAKV